MKVEIDLDPENKRGIITSDNFETIREQFSVPNKARALASPHVRRHLPERNYMISQTGRFDLGNLNEIYSFCKSVWGNNLQFEVSPDAKHHYEPSFNVPKDFQLPTHFEYPFRDTQEMGIRRAIERGRGIINATTRSGKSGVIMGISNVIMRYSPSTTIMIYVPNNICTQLFDDFLKNGFIEDQEVSLWHSTYKKTNFKAPILIVSMTIAVSNEEKFEEHCRFRNVCMIDECHRIKATNGKANKTTQRILSMPTNNVIGFTGTIPKDAENKWFCLGNIGKVIQVVTDKEAREKGYKAETQVVSFKLTGSKFRRTNKYVEDENGEKQMLKLSPTELYAQKKEYLLSNKGFNSTVVDLTLKICRGNTLITTEWDFQEEALYELFKDCGRKIVVINGKTPQEERDVIFKQTRDEKDTILIVKIGAIQEGVTINGLDYFVGHYLGKSFPRVMQAVGRIQGLSDKKATLLDFYSDLDSSEKHYAKRKEYYKEAEYSLIEKAMKVNY